MIEPFTLFTFTDSLRRSQPVAPAIARSALCQARNTKKCDMLQELSARPLLLQIIEGKLGYFCLRMHPSALFEHWQELLYFDVQPLKPRDCKPHEARGRLSNVDEFCEVSGG